MHGSLLDARDNDPVRLWTYVAAAVDRIRPGLGRATLTRLRAAADVASPIDELLNAIAGLGAELVIVLDDLQTVTDGEALASIDYAVEHLPANARVIAITRIDPALKLARLRAGGALSELRADELAFTLAEARELLVERGRHASATMRSSCCTNARRDGPPRSCSRPFGCVVYPIPSPPSESSAEITASSPTISSPRSSARSRRTSARSSFGSPSSAVSRRALRRAVRALGLGVAAG